MDFNKRQKIDIARLKYKYKRLIQTGKIKGNWKSLQALVGPDTAYQIYHQHTAPKANTN